MPDTTTPNPIQDTAWTRALAKLQAALVSPDDEAAFDALTEAYEAGVHKGMERAAAQLPPTDERWRDFTIEPFSVPDLDGNAASLLCRSDDMCEEQQTAWENDPRRHTIGEWVDWAKKHAAEHARDEAEDEAEDAAHVCDELCVDSAATTQEPTP